MALDPDAAELLAFLNTLPMPDLATATVEDMRAQARMPLPANPEPVGGVAKLTVPAETPLTLRVFTPDGDGPFPVLVFFHGGGFVFCDLDTHDPLCRRLCNTLGAVVVSVDYRLAPEHPFPAAPEDAYAATVWVAEHLDTLNGRADALWVGGDSAGGCLTAVVTLMARDRGGPMPAHQVLLYPVTRFEFNTRSYAEKGEGYFLTRDMMAWFRERYLPDPEDRYHPYASPLLAGDWHGLPPATIVTAGNDPLRDEGRAYAKKLAEAGVPVNYRCFDGSLHGFLAFMDQLQSARDALDWLRTVLTDETRTTTTEGD